MTTGPWSLAPIGVSFVGKDTEALCAQVRDRMVSPEVFLRHVMSDHRIILAFVGRRGDAAKDSEPPPVSQGQFIELADKWAKDGNFSCGCFESTSKP